MRQICDCVHFNNCCGTRAMPRTIRHLPCPALSPVHETPEPESTYSTACSTHKSHNSWKSTMNNILMCSYFHADHPSSFYRCHPIGWSPPNGPTWTHNAWFTVRKHARESIYYYMLRLMHTAFGVIHEAYGVWCDA